MQKDAQKFTEILQKRGFKLSFFPGEPEATLTRDNWTIAVPKNGEAPYCISNGDAR